MQKFIKIVCVLAISFASICFAGEVDINSANAETFAAELKGIGPSRAEAIVKYRNEHGPFKSVDDLALVQGIGSRTIDVNREKLIISQQRKN